MPALTLAACPNLGNGFAFRNFRILQGKGVAPPLPLMLVPLTPEALDGDDGGELLIPLLPLPPPLPEEKDVEGEGILPLFRAEARVAGAAAA